MDEKILVANIGYVFAYKDDNGKEVILGNMLYLGKQDDGSRYYEIEIKEDKENDRQD